jgi:hypothetical protein
MNHRRCSFVGNPKLAFPPRAFRTYRFYNRLYLVEDRDKALGILENTVCPKCTFLIHLSAVACVLPKHVPALSITIGVLCSESYSIPTPGLTRTAVPVLHHHLAI